MNTETFFEIIHWACMDGRKIDQSFCLRVSMDECEDMRIEAAVVADVKRTPVDFNYKSVTGLQERRRFGVSFIWSRFEQESGGMSPGEKLSLRMRAMIHELSASVERAR